MAQHLAQGQSQALQLSPRQPFRTAPRPYPGPKKGLVSIYVANAGKQRLVKQRSFD
jgi:hypothetical protein